MTEPLPVYRDDGRTYFCRLCQCSFVKDATSIRDHERQNPHRHRETAR